MEITKRFKNENGVITGYEVLLDGQPIRFMPEQLVSAQKSVTNAVLVKGAHSMYFRGKPGSNIDTIVEYTKKLPLKLKREDIKGDLETPYYGQEFIKICRTIRSLADQNKFQIETRPHKSNNGKNTNLFKLIEACDIDLQTFVQTYLSNLQPYALSNFQASKIKGNDKLWLSDLGYGYAFVLKFDMTNKDKPLVVSFHESNYKDSYRIGRKKFFDKPCAVIIYDCEEGVMLKHSVKYSVQRGFLQKTLESETDYVSKDVALVPYSDIESIFDKTVQLLAQQLGEIYNTKKGSFDVESLKSGNISFMSLGFATANNICMLIDLFAQYTDAKSRVIISTITENLLSEAPAPRVKSIKEALKARYLGSTNELYLSIKDF